MASSCLSREKAVSLLQGIDRGLAGWVKSKIVTQRNTLQTHTHTSNRTHRLVTCVGLCTTELVNDWNRCVCVRVCVCSPRCLADFYHSLAKVNGGNVYVYSVSCIMCVMGCRLLKCARSVIKDADFFTARWWKGSRKDTCWEGLNTWKSIEFLSWSLLGVWFCFALTTHCVLLSISDHIFISR